MNFDKTKTASIILILMLTFSATILAMPIVSAHDPAWEIPTWTYAAASPNPTGIGQEVIIVFQVNAYPPTAVGEYGDRYTLDVEVTKPDGSKENFGPITSDPVGGGYLIYTPDQVGTYTVQVMFPGATMTGEPLHPNPDARRGMEFVGDTFLPSTSEPYSINVQQEPIEQWTETPLPTQYWTRPIFGANRNWDKVAGNWLGGAAQNVGPTADFAYGLGPESPHIMWTRQYWDGGVMDARFGDIGYYMGLSYENFMTRLPPFGLNGRYYYNVFTPPRYGWYATDLLTGETLYFHNTTGPATDMSGAGSFDYSGGLPVGAPAFAQIYDYESPNQHGGFPYLWSTVGIGEQTTSYGQTTDTWMMFDAFTGNYICSIANVSTRGTLVYGRDGSILRFNIANGRLTCWNTSQAIWYEDTFLTNEFWMWRPDFNTTFDGNNGFSIDVAIPELEGRIQEVRDGQYIIGGTSGKKNSTYTEEGTLWALSLEPGKEGQLLWQISFTPPETRPDEFFPVGSRAGVQGPFVDPEDGVFVFSDKEELVWYGYSLETGQQIWGPTEKETQQNYYSTNNNFYQGMLLTYGYGGELRAYDLKTGEIVWKFTAKPVGFEFAGFENCPLSLGAIADGKIYMYTTEHSPNSPLRRGSYIRCINAANGEELWKILHWGNSMIIADGILVDLNLYDNQLYAYGKGPSQTTITGPDTALALGEEVLITGSVMDVSAGTQQQEQAGRFPNGVPAISDEYQKGWMEFVYMQQPCPADAQGVTVKLYSIDPNGNYQDLGTTITDLWGNYGINWKPPVPGKYNVIAEFEGTASYWGSSDSTYFFVGEAPSAAQSMEPELAAPNSAEAEPTTLEPTEPTESIQTQLITTETAIIAAVVVASIIGIVALWALRKRK